MRHQCFVDFRSCLALVALIALAFPSRRRPPPSSSAKARKAKIRAELRKQVKRSPRVIRAARSCAAPRS